jgi:hypothetical protein
MFQASFYRFLPGATRAVPVCKPVGKASDVLAPCIASEITLRQSYVSCTESHLKRFRSKIGGKWLKEANKVFYQSYPETSETEKSVNRTGVMLSTVNLIYSRAYNSGIRNAS